MTTTHICPGGCGRTIPELIFACSFDWRRLPLMVRHDINQTWANFLVSPAAYLTAVDRGRAWFAANPRGVAAAR